MQPTIQVTTDYKKFKDIRGNRPVNRAHVREVQRSIEVNDMTPYLPIIVNEKNEIIDGQHRFEGCVRQGKPIYYIVAKGLNLESVQMLNSTSRRWLLQDYIDSHIELGNPDYIMLKDFMTRHGLNAGISLTLLSGNDMGRLNGGSHHNKAVRDGYFKVTHPQSAELIANMIENVNKYCDFDANRERRFVAALVSLVNGAVFNIERLMYKLEQGDRIQLQPSIRHFTLEIERVYNRGAQKRVDLFTGSEEQAPRMTKAKAAAKK